MAPRFTFACLAPSCAAVAEIEGEAFDAALLPEEEAQLGRVAEKRRRDFARGRHCARRALERLGVAPGPILRGLSGEPLWPAGIRGSITHCAGYTSAVAARRTDLLGIGIDAEVRKPLEPGVVERIGVASELRWLAGAAKGSEPWDALLFSAKESVFKAWFPEVGGSLGFEDVQVEFSPGTGDFRARVLVAPAWELAGRFRVEAGHVFTAAFMRAP